MAYHIEESLIVAVPSGFIFGTGAFDDGISPPGGPPPPGSKSEIPDDWVDPPFADDVRMLLELAGGLATSWRDSPALEEEFRSYVDLALGVLYGPADPAVTQPRSVADLDDVERRLERALSHCRAMRERLAS
jgi:hypothetical protein